jgi:hypothetical protein
MAIDGDPDHWRSLPISEITAHSDTAPDQVEIERDSGAVLIKVGDPDVEVDGTHTYRVTYTMAGVVNPEAPGSGLDELSWNAVGDQWEIPLNQVSVVVNTPADVERVACFTGSDFDEPCKAQQQQPRSVSYWPEEYLEPGEGLQIVAGMPAGSFPGVEPILIERYSATRVLGLSPAVGAVSGVLALLGAALAAIGVRRFGGDRQYAGVTPGLIPAAGTETTEQRARKSPVAVQFQPPKDTTPGQLGVLTDATVDQKDVTATIIDLAVRGHLRVEEYGDPKPKWRLVATPEGNDDHPDHAPDQLRPYESGLLADLFGEEDVVELDKPGTIQTASTNCRTALYGEVTDTLGWFRGNPSSVRTRWVLAGAGILLLGVALLFVLGFTLGLGLIGVAVAVAGVAVIVAAFWAPGRTAVGHAVHVQALGFREYLKTAEADQIRFEEGVDIFSRYLPYAMIWGEAKRWTTLFAQLAERGTDLPQPAWYVGTAPIWSSGGIGSSFSDSIGGLQTAAMTASTSSSGGGSGMSGGGGVGGGGGGGW